MVKKTDMLEKLTELSFALKIFMILTSKRSRKQMADNNRRNKVKIFKKQCSNLRIRKPQRLDF